MPETYRAARAYCRALDTMTAEQLQAEVRRSLAKIRAILNPPRNAPCYCGSLKKFKKCHGSDNPDDTTTDDEQRREPIKHNP